jgi:ABC-type transporter Mla subunit MlaD
VQSWQALIGLAEVRAQRARANQESAAKRATQARAALEAANASLAQRRRLADEHRTEISATMRRTRQWLRRDFDRAAGVYRRLDSFIEEAKTALKAAQANARQAHQARDAARREYVACVLRLQKYQFAKSGTVRDKGDEGDDAA